MTRTSFCGANNLHRFIDCTSIVPSKYASTEDKINNQFTNEYLLWEQHNQLYCLGCQPRCLTMFLLELWDAMWGGKFGRKFNCSSPHKFASTNNTNWNRQTPPKIQEPSLLVVHETTTLGKFQAQRLSTEVWPIQLLRLCGFNPSFKRSI